MSAGTAGPGSRQDECAPTSQGAAWLAEPPAQAARRLPVWAAVGVEFVRRDAAQPLRGCPPADLYRLACHLLALRGQLPTARKQGTLLPVAGWRAELRPGWPGRAPLHTACPAVLAALHAVAALAEKGRQMLDLLFAKLGIPLEEAQRSFAGEGCESAGGAGGGACLRPSLQAVLAESHDWSRRR